MARRLEAESGVEVRASQDDDEWASSLFELPISRLNEIAADTLALMLWKDSDRAQTRPCDLADRHGAVHDVTNHSIRERCDQGEPGGSMRSQRADDVCLVILFERSTVHVSNRRN